MASSFYFVFSYTCWKAQGQSRVPPWTSKQSEPAEGLEASAGIQLQLSVCSCTWHMGVGDRLCTNSSDLTSSPCNSSRIQSCTCSIACACSHRSFQSLSDIPDTSSHQLYIRSTTVSNFESRCISSLDELSAGTWRMLRSRNEHTWSTESLRWYRNMRSPLIQRFVLSFGIVDLGTTSCHLFDRPSSLACSALICQVRSLSDSTELCSHQASRTCRCIGSSLLSDYEVKL